MLKKLVIGLAVLAMTLTAVSAVNAQALTADQILAALTANPGLLAQLQASLGGSSSASTGHNFTMDLTVGSKGEEVSALQQVLINGGFLTAVSAPTGYFGSATKAAVMAWQKSAGISPASGYFGPISRAALNSTTGGSTGGSTGSTLPAGCTSSFGYSTTTGQACAGAMSTVPGCTSTAGFSSTSGMPCSGSTTTGGLVADGTDGSITIGASALVSSGTAVKKGETRDVLSTKLQATGGPVSINRVEVKFSERPWLTLAKVMIKDGSGNVLATKNLTGASDATEVTVGSDYRVRFDGVNVVVRPGTDLHLVVAVTVLASSDKITGQTVTLDIPSGGIRTVNGQGFSDTIGDTADFTFTLPTTGSNGDIYSSISPSSPLAGFTTVAAGTTQTENVVLGIFRLKSQNTASTLNNLSFNLNRSTSVGTTTLFSNVRLMSGNLSYGANSLVAGGTTFTNMQVPLPQDQWVELKLTANVAGADTSSGVAASSTLVAASISGIDTNFNSLTISNAGNVTSADRTFLQSGVGISNASATLGTCAPLVTNGPNVSCGVTYTFTLTNTGNNVVYVSKTPGVTFSTSTSPTSASSTITILNTSNPTEDSADTSASWAIQSGASRTFAAIGSIKQTAGTTGPHQMSVTAIYFGASATAGAQGAASSNATSNLSTGLGALKAAANF